MAFYVDKLGFQIRFTGPDDGPYRAIIGRDDISLMHKAITPETQPVPSHTHQEWAAWDAYVATADPDTLFDEYTTNKVPFHKPLHLDGDGLKGFEIKDADGCILFFGRPDL